MPPSSFVVNGVSYSFAEQFMMTEKARLFNNHRAMGLNHVAARSKHTRNASVEACATLAPLFGIERS